MVEVVEVSGGVWTVERSGGMPWSLLGLAVVVASSCGGDKTREAFMAL